MADKIRVLSNADKIRSMSDKELAEILNKATDLDGGEIFCQNKPECNRMLEGMQMPTDEMCLACALEWLQQPAKEDA